VSEENIQQLLREGIEAARAGDKATARERFERVTELDENNERGWYYLASVVETEEEKRVCLSNVLIINPNNEKARAMMDKLDAKKREQMSEEEVMPGISRRQLTLIGGGGAAVIIVIVLIFVGITSVRNSQIAAATAEAAQIAQAQTATMNAATAISTAATATQAAIATATPTARVVDTLEPTWTPTPTWTPEVSGEAMLPTPPPSVPGTLVAWGGRDRLSNGALDLLLFPVGRGGISTKIGDQLGRDVRYAASAQRVVYSRYFSVTFDFGIEAINTNGTQAQLVQPADPPVFKLEQPDYCMVANRVVYIGVPREGPTAENLTFDETPPTKLYITDVDSNTTFQLTNDTATYIYPAFSPDCSRVAVVRNDEDSAQSGPDVVVIDIANATQTSVTKDLSLYTESTPRWTADGSQVIFAAAPLNEATNNDIVLVNSDGTGTPQLIMRSEFDDRNPVLSPDGQYLAFSSKRGEFYNIYILSLADNSLWQLTPGNGDFYPGGWWP
jgi:hypothetical protein